MDLHSFGHEMKRLRRGLAARLALMSPRFHHLLPTGTSFKRIDFRWDEHGEHLMVFLPGIGDVAEDFIRRGFIERVRHHGVASGSVVLDAHYGYYASRSLHALLRRDVLDAADKEGYQKVWMTGISLGGFGAASFAAMHPDRVAGLLLLAPYLGNESLIREIRQAGGARHWEPGRITEDDYPRRLWAWLKHAYAAGGTDMPIYLGYGTHDRFAPAHRLLEELLPPANVCALPGGHDWRTWERLWRHFMQRKDVMGR
ncbi:alpha/beta hydrolase [Noviherbaspirillum denitrificans]|uniref:AB hydrolase-1 domain-containing protein n=1 Tax=Noviherbaspirillum denitrificans TaxID=1968433 RepID=A0A254TET4_9BURK|nr:alpha/beta hydrolase [Noviherbaspirillum denitrificans]OWW21166.1 hypothetical protein AYR66_18475 [Noviherbaspirillum denitrificans]